MERIAIVTGAGRGIGEAIALAFAREGTGVTIFDIDVENAKRVHESILASGGKAIFVPEDVTKERDVENMVNQTLHSFGSIHILVNNAGIMGGGLVEETPLRCGAAP
jgi:NAD(P)-dependent dehydrogenase (short-subunit alcohol dehydrogenase family)